MSVLSLPPGWESNEITKFFDSARNNEIATFANHQIWVTRLSDIDLGYRKSIEGVNYTHNWFPVFFLHRAHSNFLAACRLCWSAQIPECHALLRSCLENAIYGLYLDKHPDSFETWLKRGENNAAKQKVRDEFKIPAILKLITAEHAEEGEAAKKLYEWTIDSGAHPNEQALMQTLTMDRNGDQIKFMSKYLDPGSVAQTAALKSTAEVGECTLSLFQIVYPERFDLMGVSDLLSRAKNGL